MEHFTAIATKGPPESQTERMHVRLEKLAEKLEEMGEQLAAVHVSMAAEQLAKRAPERVGWH
ncbi:hypothetical protein [Altericroceibacterium xinjiangense]|uniref:hypothetical protein n=1 Tax=Altericroceibacterium xinjiangense TaxID=762261 RepID=UPI000F7E51A9|nr:hypothetical protein [Altericroceibacterium xinjiangense]